MTSIDPHVRAGNLIRNQAIGKGTADPLPRLLAQLLARAGDNARVERAASRPWASALFEGRRHVVRLAISGAEAQAGKARLLDGLSEAQWVLPRHFVADICVDAEGDSADGLWVELSALTIEEW
ncbi:hypothetical protein OVY48_08930 [Sphingobium sp. SA2]|jgi:hypothetical protein|uniref:hypothetical protein n=1 Tax=Sphingobium sp. SA2 TaxID=1524832 RepID=UPI0028C0D42D|nr:hypothetical protein [Sphingobium sp. SA2]MDT7533546.1 hypothetical protein [Sphingobium sp. SA2]